jgi:hypothetical protein
VPGAGGGSSSWASAGVKPEPATPKKSPSPRTTPKKAFKLYLDFIVNPPLINKSSSAILVHEFIYFFKFSPLSRNGKIPNDKSSIKS